jgi:AraC-like DNA-binding protein
MFSVFTLENVAVLSGSLEKNRRRMVELLTDLTDGDGLRSTALDSVKLARISRHNPRTPVMYEPSIFVVASGRKKGYIGDRRFVYDRNNYLVLSVPLPFECETEVEDGEPMLGVSIRMETAVLSELAIRMDMRRRLDAIDAQQSIRPTALDLPLSEAIVRLLECLRSSADTTILGSGIVREVTYRVLCGTNGDALLAMLGRNGQLAQVHAVLQRMHAAYAEPLNVARIAEEIGMSVSAFHHNFKAVTATSPLQYLKAVRLHKARMLIIQDGVGAATAADRVGYESASQFSREFKRLFGETPMEDAARVRGMLGLDPPQIAVVA